MHLKGKGKRKTSWPNYTYLLNELYKGFFAESK